MGLINGFRQIRRKPGKLGFLAALMLALPGPSLAGEPENRFSDWQLLTVPDKTPANFTLEGPQGLRVEAMDAVAFLYKETTQTGDRRLTWRWRVDKGLPPSPQDRVGQDDRPLAVHIWFPTPPEKRSFFDDLGSLFGYPAIGRVLTYVWGGTRERGTVMDHPHFDEGKLIVLRGPEASLEAWYDESIDLAADYRQAFGETPPARIYIAISADSDDLGGMSSAALEALGWGDQNIGQAVGQDRTPLQKAARR